MMTSYLFISNSLNFKIDNKITTKISSILNNKNIKNFCIEIVNQHFYEWKLHSAIVEENTKREIKDFCNKFPIDVNFMKISQPRKKKMLVCDMDSTIIKEESLDEIAKEAGIGDKVMRITAKAMKGDLDFENAILERIKLLQNFPLERVIEFNKKIRFHDGAKELIKKMNYEKCTTILISGGFTPSVSYVAKKLGFDYYHCNNFLYKKDKGKIVINGNVQIPILNKNSKLFITKQYVKKLGLTLEDVISVGDGANDIELVSNSGIGVSFKGKPILNKKAKAVLDYTDLTGLLYFQGYKTKF
tara:strand:- start:874 stop:1776 length:903 start_codon:yes stop_codon:yes gene_type:complete